MTYQNRAPAFSIGVPTPPLLAVLTGCRNSMTARTLRRVSVLWWAASSCRDRGGSAPSSCHYRGTNPGFDFLLVSLSWYKPWLVVDVVGGGVHSFFLRVGRYRYPHPAQCKFAYPPRLHRLHKDSINYIIILSYRLCRVSVLWWVASSCRHRWFKPWAAASSCRHRWLNPVVVSLSIR